MPIRKVNDELFVAGDGIVRLGRQDVEALKAQVRQTARKRVRVCADRGPDDLLHEMLIVLGGTTYIRPHKHEAKSESFHVVEGSVDVVIFDDEGDVSEVIPLGEYGSGQPFYYRLSDPYFHTLLIRTDCLVIHETTNGPFRRADTVFAPWAPEEGDAEGIAEFMGRLDAAVHNLRHPAAISPFAG